MDQLKRLTRRCGFYEPTKFASYEGLGGFRGLRRARTLSSEAILAEISASGLRGRGGAGFPTGAKWSDVASRPGDLKFLLCNADEGELGTFKDRLLLEGDPLAVLEGMLIASLATGTREGTLYINGEYTVAADMWDEIAALAREEGLTAPERGGRWAEIGVPFTLHVVRGRGLYIAGEECALIASLEAARPMGAPKPPYPTESGLFGRPTLVQNVETLANVPCILADGAEAFRTVGTAREPGTRLYSLSGDVRYPGVYELPTGSVTLRQFVEDCGGGVPAGGSIKAIQPGGGTSAFLAGDGLDCVLASDALRAAGSSQGTGAVLVYGSRRNMVHALADLMEYYGRQSCGRCLPCRIGSVTSLCLIERILSGDGSPADTELLGRTAQACAKASTCGMGQSFPLPILSAMALFPGDFDVLYSPSRLATTVGNGRN